MNTQSIIIGYNKPMDSSCISEQLYVGMTRVKSHVIRAKNASKLGEKA